MYRSFFKRLLDIIFSAVALFIVSPIFIIIGITYFLIYRHHPFFIQERPGKNARVFKVIKFKTMRDERDEEGRLLPDDQRLTGIGRFIRSTSIDELPQLINVLKGDMSLIGPRPLLVKYLPLYSPEQAKRHKVRPGITGWAQVNGRNTLSWYDKFSYDIYYVDHLNFALDLKILLLTIKKVLLREGISSENSVTMEEFKGNN
jgi:lipopolysaccharide/colanic/teichoic acid biosynthesis glycosyltransferase